MESEKKGKYRMTLHFLLEQWVNGGTVRKMTNAGYRMGLTGPEVIEQKLCFRTILSRKLD